MSIAISGDKNQLSIFSLLLAISKLGSITLPETWHTLGVGRSETCQRWFRVRGYPDVVRCEDTETIAALNIIAKTDNFVQSRRSICNTWSIYNIINLLSTWSKLLKQCFAMITFTAEDDFFVSSKLNHYIIHRSSTYLPFTLLFSPSLFSFTFFLAFPLFSFPLLHHLTFSTLTSYRTRYVLIIEFGRLNRGDCLYTILSYNWCLVVYK